MSKTTMSVVSVVYDDVFCKSLSVIWADWPKTKRVYISIADRIHSFKLWQQPELTKEIVHTVWCNDQLRKLGKEEGLGWCLEFWPLSSQVTVLCDKALLSWKWLNLCLLMAPSEWILYFALFTHAAFAFSIKISLSQPSRFFSFLLIWFPSPACWERDAWAAVWGLSCWLW